MGYIKTKKPLVVMSYLYSLSVIASFIYYKSINNICMPFIMCFFIVIMFALMVLKHDKISFANVSVAFLGTTYLTMFLMCVYFVRILPNGKLYIWLPFILAWLTDTFAYFVGVFFGKHKLIPSVSPKKTIEGSVGGIVGAIVTMVVYSTICSKITLLQPKYIVGIVLAVVCSIASQFGDLSASCIKREHDAKDFGSLMPGHGGVLDRFDSVIYIAPIVYWFLANYGIFS